MNTDSGSDSGSGAAYPMTDYRSLITVFYTSHCSSLYILASRSMILRECSMELCKEAIAGLFLMVYPA